MLTSDDMDFMSSILTFWSILTIHEKNLLIDNVTQYKV